MVQQIEISIMGDHIKIPLEVCYFLHELYKMRGNTIVGEQERKK